MQRQSATGFGEKGDVGFGGLTPKSPKSPKSRGTSEWSSREGERWLFRSDAWGRSTAAPLSDDGGRSSCFCCCREKKMVRRKYDGDDEGERKGKRS